jgi:hypothetical protein
MIICPALRNISQASYRKVFFFEKKKQKTFTPSLWPQARAQ